MQGKLGKSLIANSTKPWFRPSQALAPTAHISIIGGGIAGGMMALHLNKQGYKTTLIENNDHLLCGTSGNPAAILFPFLGLGQSIEKEFYRKAYLYCLDFYKSLGSGIFDNCGLLKIAKDRLEIEHFKKLASQYDDQILTLKDDSLFLHKSGIVKPDKVANFILKHTRVMLKTHVTALNYENGSWSLFDDNEQIIIRSDAVIICNSFNIDNFEQTGHLPLDKISGQISYMKPQHKDKNVLFSDGYLTPPIKTDVGLAQICGGTFEQNVSHVITDEAHIENISKSPRDFGAHMIIGGRRGIRAMSPDHFPIVGPAPNWEKYRHDYHYLYHGPRHKKFPAATYHDNLFICTGLGTRGFLSAPMLGKFLTAMISGNNLPFDERISNALHPGRFIIRKLSKK